MVVCVNLVFQIIVALCTSFILFTSSVGILHDLVQRQGDNWHLRLYKIGLFLLTLTNGLTLIMALCALILFQRIYASYIVQT